MMLKVPIWRAGPWQIRRSCRMVHPEARHPESAFVGTTFARERASWIAVWTGPRSLVTFASQEDAHPVTTEDPRSNEASDGAATVEDTQPPAPAPLPSPRKRGRKPKGGAADGAARRPQGLGGTGKRSRAPRPPTADQSSSRLKWTPGASLALSRCIVQLAQRVEQQQDGTLETSPKEQLLALAAAHPELKGYTADELFRKRANVVYQARLTLKEKEKAAASLGPSASEQEIIAAAMGGMPRILPSDVTLEVYKVLEPHLEVLRLPRGLRSTKVKSTTRASSVKGSTGEKQKQPQPKAMRGRGRPPKKESAARDSVESSQGSGKPLEEVLKDMDRLFRMMSKVQAELRLYQARMQMDAMVGKS